MDLWFAGSDFARCVAMRSFRAAPFALDSGGVERPMCDPVVRFHVSPSPVRLSYAAHQCPERASPALSRNQPT